MLLNKTLMENGYHISLAKKKAVYITLHFRDESNSLLSKPRFKSVGNKANYPERSLWRGKQVTCFTENLKDMKAIMSHSIVFINFNVYDEYHIVSLMILFIVFVSFCPLFVYMTIYFCIYMFITTICVIKLFGMYWQNISYNSYNPDLFIQLSKVVVFSIRQFLL